MLTPERWFAPVAKLTVALAGAMLLAFLVAVTDGGRTAEAGSLQPVAAQSEVSADLCGGYLIDGRWVHQYPCNPPVVGGGCFQWGCGNPCAWQGCGNPCAWQGCGCAWQGCGNPCYHFGCHFANAGHCGINYGCGNFCNNTCGNPCGAAQYVRYGGHIVLVNNRCAAPVTSLRFESPPQAVFCGSNTALSVLAPGLVNGSDVHFTASLGTVATPVDVITGRATTTLSVPFGVRGLSQVTARWDGVSTSTIIQVVC
jgi:hypothetical protein